MIDNKDSKKRYRVDHLIEGHAEILKNEWKRKRSRRIAGSDGCIYLPKMILQD